MLRTSETLFEFKANSRVVGSANKKLERDIGFAAAPQLSRQATAGRFKIQLIASVNLIAAFFNKDDARSMASSLSIPSGLAEMIRSKHASRAG